ncbi:hypothetical protein VD0004_g8215 [Verticillium dahliae]|nr:hypothetical protein VD0004_g8215 [Verticillium dahliae]PNH48696.1 hypothetical protein VD0003_g8427 [Verticillium dahliae]
MLKTVHQSSLIAVEDVADWSTDTWKLALFWIWAEAEPNATIVAASIPVLRDLVRNVRSGRGPSAYSSGQYIRSDTLSKFQAPSNAEHSRR